MKKTFKFILETEVEIDGKHPGDELLNNLIIDSLLEHFPSVMFDDDELNCAVFVHSCSFTPV